MQREDDMSTWGEESHLHAKERDLRRNQHSQLLDLCLSASSTVREFMSDV